MPSWRAQFRFTFGRFRCFTVTDGALHGQWQEEWNELPADERLRHQARQGVRSLVLNETIVADPTTFVPVPRDGHTMGEILMRGNLTMKGYFKNSKATAEAFAGGWYHTG